MARKKTGKVVATVELCRCRAIEQQGGPEGVIHIYKLHGESYEFKGAEIHGDPIIVTSPDAGLFALGKVYDVDFRERE